MTTPADTLNTAAALAQAARDALEKAEQNLQRLTKELERARQAYAAAEAEREAAIEASIADPSVLVPRLDASSVELAERKCAAAQRAIAAAREALASAERQLSAAREAFEIDHARDAAKRLYDDIAKLKSLATFLAFQESDKVREVLHEEGFRVGRDAQSAGLVIHCRQPRRVPSLSEACAQALGKSQPAARKLYTDASERAQSMLAHVRDLAIQTIDQRERNELARLQAGHEGEIRNMHPFAAARKALTEKFGKLVDKRKAEYAAERQRHAAEPDQAEPDQAEA